MSDDDPYQELLDESRHREVLEARARQRSVAARLRDDATLIGTLTELADHGATVTVRTEAGSTHRARVTAVALDHVVLRPDPGPTTYVTTDAIVDVRPDPATQPAAAAGAGGAQVDRTLVEQLDRDAEDRPRVQIRVRGHREPVVGRLEAVGRDVVSVRSDGDGGVSYLRLGAITEVTVEP